MRADTERGQLVLLAAIAVTVALVPLAFAYLQLGYHEDVGTATERDPARQLTQTLDRSLHNATSDIPRSYRWHNRTSAATTVRERLSPTLRTLSTSRLAEGHVYQISYNTTRATQWGQTNCPRGPDRQFGACDWANGIVLQERSGQTHVLGIAVDIEITTPRGETTITTVRLLDSVQAST